MRKPEGRMGEVYNFIAGFIAENGFSPSVRDICRGVGFRSPSSAQSYINRLQEQGYIEKAGNKMRTVKLAGTEQPESRVPIVGRVAAGVPLLAVEDDLGTVGYSGPCDPEQCFALCVRGDSMIDDGIYDGDVIVVRRQPTAENGELVVAMAEDSATVKRLKLVDGETYLMPANKAYLPIRCRKGDILGKVVALRREY